MCVLQKMKDLGMKDFQIAGLHKMSTIDFKGSLALVVFVQGCNFYCSYCHNPDLIAIKDAQGEFSPSAVLSFLEKRINLLDGVVISGGEPTLQKGLLGFCKEVKALGYKVKIDSNASCPEVLESLIGQGLVDYFALDCKATPAEYCPDFVQEQGISSKIMLSARLVQDSGLPHEFRTTCVKGFVGEEKLGAMLEVVGKKSPWYFQLAKLAGLPRARSLQALTREETSKLVACARGLGANAFFRGEG